MRRNGKNMKDTLSTHNEVARTDSYTSPLLVTVLPLFHPLLYPIAPTCYATL
jgi:hypothetical protein